MLIDLDDLPSDPALLQGLVRDMAAAVESRDGEIERLQSIIKKLQRVQFGRRSERLDPEQLGLALEELDADVTRIQESRPIIGKPSAERPAQRKRLPDHLPREDVVLDVPGPVCACCGGALHAIGESISEMLDWVPAQLRVIRTLRPKYACWTQNGSSESEKPPAYPAGRQHQKRPSRRPPPRDGNSGRATPSLRSRPAAFSS